MKDLALVGPILIVGAALLASTQSASRYNPQPYHTQELVLLAFLFGLLYAWHRGKQTAEERMKALELGWNLADGPPSPALGRNAFTVVLLTPVSLLGVAWFASSSRPDLSTPIWSAASLLGVTTLICGTILLLRLPSPSPTQNPNFQRRAVLKPKTDPDEFDVVSQRGSNGHP